LKEPYLKEPDQPTPEKRIKGRSGLSKDYRFEYPFDYRFESNAKDVNAGSAWDRGLSTRGLSISGV